MVADGYGYVKTIFTRLISPKLPQQLLARRRDLMVESAAYALIKNHGIQHPSLDTIHDSTVLQKKRRTILMSVTTSTPFQEALDCVDRLPLGDQEALVEIVRKRLVDKRRREIAGGARSTPQAFREGRAVYGTVEDLRRELEE
jgi:hypothetical protein